MSESTYHEEYRTDIDRLTDKRKKLGLSQTYVAEKIGKTQAYMSKTETYQRRLDILERRQLSDLYKREEAQRKANRSSKVKKYSRPNRK